MSTIGNCNNCTTPTNNQSLANYRYANLTRASINVQASAGISLTTEDGDKVTISANSSTQARLQTYNFLGQLQGQTVAAQGEEFQLATSSGFSIAVEGDLDQEELSDIKKLLNSLSAVSKDFFSGNPTGGLRHLSRLDDLDSIDSFQANFSYSLEATAVSASQLSLPEVSRTQEESEPADDAPTVAIPAPGDFLAQLTNALAALNRSEKDAGIPKRFGNLFEKMLNNQPLENDDRKLADKIQSEHAKRGHGHRHGDHAEQSQQASA